jgi:MarR family 2-MHQ and catechol resistance regulon transcriptional repressor
MDVARRSGSTPGIHVWLVLMKAYRALAQRSMGSIANTGMCFTDFAILEALLHKGPLPVNTMAPLVNLTSGSMTTAVDRLQSRGLVRRAADPGDRRARIVQLTPEGHQLIEGVFRQHSGDMEEVASVLSPNERETLLRLLKKLGRHAASIAP